MENPVEPTSKLNQPTLQMIRKGLLEAVVGLPITLFETARETAMKGYTTFAPRGPGNDLQPTLTPPQIRYFIMLVICGMDTFLQQWFTGD